QIESEYALFETSYQNQEVYERYHLISGTHMPLKNQNEIHKWFDNFKGKEVLNYLYTDSYEANFKVNRLHFFVRNYRSPHIFIERTAQLLWDISLKSQYKLNIQRKEPNVRIKANNWVSLTESAVKHIIQQKKQTLKMFRYSFCGDAFFVPYLLAKMPDKF